MLGGYVGKLLRVDLTDKTIKEDKMPEESTLRKYVGGLGLGLKLLYDETPLGISPLEPENPLIFMTGPLTGTIVPSPTNTTIVTLNYNTGYTAGRAHTHGIFGPYVKFSGYDGIIIVGASEKPVYLWIHEGGPEIRDADKVWGKDTHETEDLIKAEIGEPKASVAAIGPAGENLCHGALIENDYNHSASKSGVGAVMGSKKLKAIAVYGDAGISVADNEHLKKVAKDWTMSTKGEGVASIVRNAGVPRGDYRGHRSASLLVVKNMTTTLSDFGDGMSKNKITPRPCFRCPIACSYDIEITSGPHKGFVATVAGGGENLEGGGPIVGITEIGAVFKMVELHDRLGFDSAEAGCTLALAFEAYEKGLITKKDTVGLDLRWGNFEAAKELLTKMARKEGIGKIMALGPKGFAEAIGGEALNSAIHVKGAGINLHDWRASWGVLLSQAVGGGSGWAGGGVYFSAESDLGYFESQMGKPSALTPQGKAEEVAKSTYLKYWTPDSVGVCWFATWGIPKISSLSAQALSAATGWNFSPEEGMMVGERILSLERVFNIRRGLTPDDDFDIGPRLLEAPQDGMAKGKSIKPYLRGLVAEYYRLNGWDEKTGKPWASTLRKLGLEDCIRDVWS